MKIDIIGSVASGKTTLAKNILIIPYDSFHESQIWIPAIRGNRTIYTHMRL